MKSIGGLNKVLHTTLSVEGVAMINYGKNLGKPDPTVFDLVTEPDMKYLWKITYPDSEVEYMVTKDRVTMMEETKRLNNVHKPDEVKVEVLDFARVLDIDREYLTAVVED
jgi:hypothetical protein